VGKESLKPPFPANPFHRSLLFSSSELTLQTVIVAYEYIRFHFYIFFFYSVFDSMRRKFKLTSASFWGHVKLAYRIVSYRICCTVFRRQPVQRARVGGGSDEAPTNEAHSQLPNWFRLARYQPWSPLVYTPPSASWHDRLSTHRPGGK